MFGNTNEFEMNSNISGNNNIIENEMNVDIDMMSNQQAPNEISGGMTSPITEAVQEDVFIELSFMKFHKCDNFW